MGGTQNNSLLMMKSGFLILSHSFPGISLHRSRQCGDDSSGQGSELGHITSLIFFTAANEQFVK